MKAHDGIWIHPEQLKEQAAVMRESAVNLAGLYRQMEEHLAALEKNWLGNDAASGIQRGKRLKEELHTCAESFLTLSDSMKQIAQQSEEAEKSAGKRMDG